MRKVLIVSYYFAPGSTIGAKRYGIMCKFFKENGYDPYILTAPVYTTYLGAKFDLPLPVSNDKIIRVKAEQTAKSAMTFIINQLRKHKFDSRTVNSTLFWYSSIKKSVNLEQLRDIDVVIGTYGPIGNLYAARYLAKKLRCKYIADMRDLIADSKSAAEGRRRSFKLDRLIETGLLHSADAIVTVSPELTKLMKKKYPQKRICTIYNGWDEERRGDIELSREKYLYYAGSLYEERINCLAELLQALKIVNEIEEIKMVIRSMGPRHLDKKAKCIIKNMGMQEMVVYLHGTDESVVREECQKAYINVVLNSVHEDGIETKAALPGKTFELVNEKVPILAISPENSRLSKLLTYTDKGIGTVDPKKIVEFILTVEGKYNGNHNIYKFTRENQAMRLCKFMDLVFKKK